MKRSNSPLQLLWMICVVLNYVSVSITMFTYMYPQVILKKSVLHVSIASCLYLQTECMFHLRIVCCVQTFAQCKLLWKICDIYVNVNLC